MKQKTTTMQNCDVDDGNDGDDDDEDDGSRCKILSRITQGHEISIVADFKKKHK